MAKGEPVGRHTRRTGLIVAASAFLLGAGVVGFFIATSKSKPTDTPKPVIPNVPAMAQPPTTLPPIDLGSSQPGTGSIVDVVRPTIQFIDKQDPARVAGQLQWESLDPLDNGRSAITKPVGYYYLRNGAVVEIKAAKGRIYTPARSKQPESGTFDGGVVFSLFEPDAAGQIDVKTHKPSLRAETRSIDFDLATGDVSSPDPFTITSDLVQAKGKGFQVLYNQVTEAINLLQINEQAEVTIHPEAARRKHTALNPDKPAPAVSTDAPTPAQRVAMYRALFSTSVKITQGKRTISGDEMEVFLRLVNNQLPARAFGERAESSGPSTASAPSTTRPDQQLLAADQPVTLTWVGKLTVRPLDSTPRELESDHLLARITGSQTGPARAADDALRATALATTFQIGATTRDLVVSGKPGAPARLAAAGRGTLTTPQLRLNLGTGLGTLDGPGELVGDPTSRELAAGPVAPDRRASWTDRAEIQLSAAGDALTGQLEVATFLGGVTASSRAGEVHSDLARITFSPVEGKASTSELAAVNLRGNVRAQAGHGEADATRGTLTADAVDLRFEPTDTNGDPTPVELLAQGRVKAARQDQSLAAEILTAALGRDAGGSGDVQLRTALAESNVVFTGAKGLKATTNRLDADAGDQTVLLTGAGTQITRDASTLDGEQFLLRGKSRELEGFGPGTFNHARGNAKPATGSPQAALPNQVSASWQHSLIVNDPDGQAIVEGGAVVTAAGDQETSTLKAAQVIINFTPLPIAADAGGAPKSEPAPERKFVSADAIGSLNPTIPGLAIVESRRYTDADALLTRDDKKLERLLYLESARISASETDGTISVPQAGKLLVADRRPADQAAPKPVKIGDGGIQLAGAHGTSLFSWRDKLTLRRNAGTVEMNGKTRLIHQPEGQNTPFILDADKMTAWFSQNGTAATAQAVVPNARNTQLLKAVADDAVLAESGDQRLTADILSFDVPTNTIEAAATGPNNVVLSDKTRPSPLSARKLIWQLGAGGQIRVIEPATGVIPQ